jgi:hypothetical protein
MGGLDSSKIESKCVGGSEREIEREKKVKDSERERNGEGERERLGCVLGTQPAKEKHFVLIDKTLS